MAPKGKSSASSATRKKHARKAAAAHGDLVEEPQVTKEKKPKGKDKKSKKEPRKKVYIPPVKPAPVQPDPLDTLGLAQKLPPELLVVLRLLSKKDATTKRRALEDLQTSWVGRVKRGEEGEYLLYTLQEIVPVWLHHLPSLFLHPSRRIRLQAIGLHSSILQIPPLRAALFFQIREVVTSDQAESILGSWCLTVHDVDRQVSSFARESWARYVTASGISQDKLFLDSTLFPRLWEFVQRTLLDPAGVYLYINPPQPIAPTPASSRKGSGRGTPIRKDDEPIGRSKADEEEEKEQDKKARLRVGAFGATEWVLNARFASPSEKQSPPEREEDHEITSRNEFLAAFANPALWSALYWGKVPPFADTESFGYEQPVVRRSAWSLVQCLIQRCKGHLGPLLPILSRAVLRSAWVELDPIVRGAMWQPLLMFLKEYPSAWTVEAEPEEEDEDEDEDSDIEGAEGPKPPRPPAGATPSQAYAEFLQFLTTGCNGSPVQGYPAILVILSTIPSSTMALSSSHPLEDLFTSFWAAVDARVLNSLDRVVASTAFLSSLLECLVYVARRLIGSPTAEAATIVHGIASDQVADVNETVKGLLQDHFRRTWDELASGKLKVPSNDVGRELAKALSSLCKLRPDLFDASWTVITAAVQSSVNSEGGSTANFVPGVLLHLSNTLEKDSTPGNCARSLIRTVVNGTLDRCAAILNAEEAVPAGSASIVGILEAFGELVFADSETTKSVDDLVQCQTHRLLATIPSLLFLYLKHRQDEEACLLVWHQILQAIASHTDEIDSVLSSILTAVESKTLPAHLRPADEELRDAAGFLLSEALSGPPNANQVVLIRRLLVSYKYFISDSCRESLLRGIIDAFILHLDNALRDNQISLVPLNTPLDILHGLIEGGGAKSLLEVSSVDLLPHVYLLVFLMPQYCNVDKGQKATASSLWFKSLEHADMVTKQSVLDAIKHLFRELVCDWIVVPTPQQILRAVRASPFTSDFDVLSGIFPSPMDLDGMLSGLPSTPLDPSLAVVDLLIPPPTLYRSDKVLTPDFDVQGLSAYARIVYGLLLLFADDRQTARANIWALRYFFALGIYAEEMKHLPSVESPVFSKSVPKIVLQEILDKVQQLATYTLSANTEDQWHTDVTKTVLAQGPADRLDGIGRFVIDLINHARDNDTIRESRVLHSVLRHVLNTATKADAEQWMLVARKLEKQAPHTSLAITFSITRYAPEPTRLDRFRNELAAGALGVPAAKANAEGLRLMRNLAAAAPDPESDVAFLPQPRAVNLVKACQQWITSDEDLEEDVQSEMTLVFAAIVPILSNVPGGHWDLMFDVIENNLENSSLDDSSTFVTLARTLQLFLIIEDFAGSNKMLRDAWDERKSNILELIRDLIALRIDDEKPSTPLSVCRELALQIVQDLPARLMVRDTLPKMCHLVMDGSANVQRMAHQLLQKAAKKYTEELIIEAAMDTEGAVKSELPTELLDILQRNLNHEETAEFGQEWFGYLLAWMVTFDLFADASLKVKSGYIDQLRDLDLVGSRLLPSIFGLLDLYGGMARAFKLDIWDVDEYYLDFYSPESPLSLHLLAAHLYYRALLVVPSLIRNWLVDCRDRQLSTAVASYTSKHFSPAIIRTELARVKDPDALAAAPELSGENVTIKVSTAVHEVTASYAVDEQRLELTVKLPADWPLHTIEIRDSKLVGVTEDRWRAWVLGVQQILTFRSGSIVDGLSFFLKNVTSHFEGIAECAICYSIVNATDGSLPRKPCKTCKNRFHAACLYKWFNTSHSSSCPLCRSEIMTGK